MTAKLQIPEGHREDLALILALDDTQVEAFVHALDTVVVMSPAAFASEALVPGVEPLRLGRMFSALRILYRVRGHDSTELPAFVDAIVEAIRSAGDPKLTLAAEDVARTTATLLRLLSATEFSVTVKAQDLASEAQRMLYGSRVLTDVRPVFRESVSDEPAGMLIIHTLKIEYHIHDYRHEDIYLTIPPDQLITLRDAITRAIAKAETLQTRLSSAGFVYLDYSKAG